MDTTVQSTVLRIVHIHWLMVCRPDYRYIAKRSAWNSTNRAKAGTRARQVVFLLSIFHISHFALTQFESEHEIKAITMVENKKSAYDNDNPHMFQATAASVEGSVEGMEADLLRLDAREVDEESTGASRHDSTEADILIDDGVPTLPTEEEDLQQKRKVGAGIFSGVVGFFLGGPILAVIFGFGAAYASDKNGAVGDSARAVGDVASMVKEKAFEIDKKHSVVDRGKVVAADAYDKAKEMDQKHHILEKTKDFLVYSWHSLVDFVRRHRVVECGVEGVGRGAVWSAEKISKQINQVAPPATESAAVAPASGK